MSSFSPIDVVTIWVPFLLFVVVNMVFGNALAACQRLIRRGDVLVGIRTFVAQQATASDNLLYYSVLDYYHEGVHYRFEDYDLNDSDETLSYVPSDAVHRWVRVWVDPADPRIAVSSEGRSLELGMKILVCSWIAFNVAVTVIFSDFVQRFGGAYVLVLLALLLIVVGVASRYVRAGSFLWRRARPVVTSTPWHYVREFDESKLRTGATD